MVEYGVLQDPIHCIDRLLASRRLRAMSKA
jgi:hypothetical protein